LANRATGISSLVSFPSATNRPPDTEDVSRIKQPFQ